MTQSFDNFGSPSKITMTHSFDILHAILLQCVLPVKIMMTQSYDGLCRKTFLITYAVSSTI